MKILISKSLLKQMYKYKLSRTSHVEVHVQKIIIIIIIIIIIKMTI